MLVERTRCLALLILYRKENYIYHEKEDICSSLSFSIRFYKVIWENGMLDFVES